MTRQPQVSVVIPVKNGGRTIGAAVESVLAQDYPHFELVVILAPSHDDTGMVVRSYPEVRVVEQMSRGIVGGFNEGIEAAQGDFVAFNGDDDLWMPTKLSKQMEAFRSDPGVQVVTCLMEYFLDNGAEPPRGFRTHLLEGAHVGNNCETMLARRGLFESLGSFDEAYTVAFDVDFFARVADAGIKHVVIDEVLVHKRVHDGAQHLKYVEQNNQQLLSIAARSLARKRGNPRGTTG